MKYRNTSSGGSRSTRWTLWKRCCSWLWERREKRHSRRGIARIVAITAGAVLVPIAVTMGILTGCSRGSRVSTEESRESEAVPRPPDVSETLPDAFKPHPAFDLTLGELRALLEEERPEVRGPVLSRPQAFLELVQDALAEPEELLWLVDKEHPLPGDYAPEDLVDLEQYQDQLTLNRDNLSLRLLVMPDLLAMVEAAAQEGVILDLSSTYRSYAYQEWLFEYWVEQLGRERAEQSSARAGASQHQLGTAIDFGSVTGPFAEHPAGRWLAANAYRFGFSLSYPQGYEGITGYIFEPWHFRYISRPATQLEQRYFGGIQQFLLEFWHRHGEFFRRRHLNGG